MAKVSNLRAVWAAVRERFSRYGLTFGGKRDLEEALGYQPTLEFGDYMRRYKRGGLAKRIVKLPVDYTWQRPPEIYEDEDPKRKTEFEDAIEELVKRTKLWSYMRRADRLSRVGRYSVIFLGFNDGAAFEQEVTAGDSLELAYVSVFSEGNARVQSLGIEGERTGLPMFYEIDFSRRGFGTDRGSAQAGVKDPTFGKKQRVHWSRVIHVVDDPDEDDIYGAPALEVGWNRFDDLDKVIGASAEAAWKNGLRQTVYTTDKDAEFSDTDESTEGKQTLVGLNEQIEDLEHGLKSYAVLQGMTASAIQGEVPDATGPAGAIVAQLAGTYGYPQRILVGSERGNLASTQDRENLAAHVRDRQSNQTEQNLVRPTIDRLIELGVLPEVDEYFCDWRDPLISSSAERAAVAYTIAQGAQLVSGDAGKVYKADEFREDIGREPLDPDDDPDTSTTDDDEETTDPETRTPANGDGSAVEDPA